MARAECSLTRARRENQRRNDRAARLAATFAHRRSSTEEFDISRRENTPGSTAHECTHPAKAEERKQTSRRREGKGNPRPACCLANRGEAARAGARNPRHEELPVECVLAPSRASHPSVESRPRSPRSARRICGDGCLACRVFERVVDAEGRIVVDIDREETLALCIIDKSSGPRRGLISRSRGAYRPGSVETLPLPA